MEAGEHVPSQTAGILACGYDAPYCATTSLYWSNFFYTNWQCTTRAGLTAELLAVATSTGNGPANTHYLTDGPYVTTLTDNVLVTTYSLPSGVYATATAPFSGSETTTSSDEDTGSSGISGGAIGGIVGAIAAVVVAVAAVIQCVCVKAYHRQQRAQDAERDRRHDSTSRDLVVRRPADLERAMRGEMGSGRGLNVYIQDFHYHDHRGGGISRLRDS